MLHTVFETDAEDSEDDDASQSTSDDLDSGALACSHWHMVIGRHDSV